MEHIPVPPNMINDYYPNAKIRVIGPPQGLGDQVDPADMLVDITNHGPVFRGYFMLDKEELEVFKDPEKSLVIEVFFWGDHLHPFGAKAFSSQ